MVDELTTVSFPVGIRFGAVNFAAKVRSFSVLPAVNVRVEKSAFEEYQWYPLLIPGDSRPPIPVILGHLS